MAGMAGDHRPAARLGHVADQEAVPAACPATSADELLDIVDELRLAPVAVARQAHHLPVRPVDGQRLAAGHAAIGIGADRPRLARRRHRGLAEQHLGRRPGGERLPPRRPVIAMAAAARIRVIVRARIGMSSEKARRKGVNGELTLAPAFVPADYGVTAAPGKRSAPVRHMSLPCCTRATVTAHGRIEGQADIVLGQRASWRPSSRSHSRVRPPAGGGRRAMRLRVGVQQRRHPPGEALRLPHPAQAARRIGGEQRARRPCR